MEESKMEQAIVEVNSSFDYEDFRKLQKFLRDRMANTRLLVCGFLMLIPTVMFCVSAVLAIVNWKLWISWAVLLLPLGCVAFSVLCFVRYRRFKPDAIKLEKPKFWSPHLIPKTAPFLVGGLIGVLIAINDDNNILYVLYACVVVFLLAVVIFAKKGFKSVESICAFYESYLLFSYKAMDMDVHVQKGVQYSACYAQETEDAFYVQMPAERNGFRPATPYYDNIILNKRHFAPDQVTALRELFASKFGEKFKGTK